MKQHIIAIGGGRTAKTLAIDQEIIRASGKKNPRLLFVPTASGEPQEYIDLMQEHFTSLGAVFDTLLFITQKPTPAVIQTKIAAADIIYVGGGNTLKMMNLWRRLGVDKELEKARERGAVLCGVSAGSICWFSYGNSDSRKSINPAADYIKVTGLGFIKALHCPHFNSEAERKESLIRMMKQSPLVAIALDDCAALQVKNDRYRIITSHDAAKAYKIYWEQGKLYEEPIAQSSGFSSLKVLLQKKQV